MKKEVVERYVWTKNEIRDLLIEDLVKCGIKVEGETSLSFADMVVIFEIWPSRMSTDKTLGQGEGVNKGKDASQAKRGT